MRSLLQGASRFARASRAKWVVALHDLQNAGRPWCTLAEWIDLWPSDAENHDDRAKQKVAAKQQRCRLRSALRAIGLDLLFESPSGEGLRIHVGSPELRQLVAVDLPLAHAVLEHSEAKLDPGEVARNYWMFSASLSQLGRASRAHARVVRSIIRAARKPIRPRGRPRIEAERPRELVEKATRAVWKCAAVSEVGRILLCSRTTARRFRDRTLRSGPPTATRS